MQTIKSLDERLHRWFLSRKKSTGTQDVSELGAVAGTEIGLVRRENQDRVALAKFSFADAAREDFVAAILCDGIGGVANGGASASIAVRAIIAALSEKKSDDLTTLLNYSIHSANKAVYSAFPGNGGTTVAAVLASRTATVASTAGDSRVYQFKERKFTQISEDDTIAGELSRLTGTTASLPDELARSLSQYIGMGDGLRPKQYSLSKDLHLSLLLTSDGAHRFPSFFETFYSETVPPHVFVNRIFATSRWTGGVDNASIILIPLDDEKLFQGIQSSSPLLEIWDAFGKVEFFDPFPVPQAASEVVDVDEPKRFRKSPSKRKNSSSIKRDKKNHDVDPETAKASEENIASFRTFSIEVNGSPTKLVKTELIEFPDKQAPEDSSEVKKDAAVQPSREI